MKLSALMGDRLGRRRATRFTSRQRRPESPFRPLPPPTTWLPSALAGCVSVRWKDRGGPRPPARRRCVRDGRPYRERPCDGCENTSNFTYQEQPSGDLAPEPLQRLAQSLAFVTSGTNSRTRAQTVDRSNPFFLFDNAV